ncbi:MAG: serine/threonine protein kinase [Solibacterales bacterium]|nr:serine/threonine protein kinase [Bryobacterales bacterium]|tara:strand:+ start:375 stop:1709 length:1335 start_codon:yes stop_codon:yes gene_type:complete
MISRRNCLKVISSGFFAGKLSSFTWPQFRGPGALGIVPDNPGLPISWDSTENIVWKTDVPGKGWSSPVVWNERIYLTSNIGPTGKGEPPAGFYEGGEFQPITEKTHHWMAYGINFISGQIEWETELHRGIPKTPRHRKNSYASETPVTDGDHIYVHFGDLATYCLDMTGKVAWSVPWKPVETRWGYGTASSPALHENQLYITNDNEGQSYTVAIDKQTGKEIWKVDRDEPTTWSTPFVWTHADRTEIITAGRKKIRSYDPNGRLLWELSGMSSLSIPTPFASDGLLYVTSGYHGSQERPIYAIRPGASGDITLKSGETSNEYISWSVPQGGPYHPSPVVYEGLHYTLLDRGFLTCHDARTGKQIYGKQRIALGSGNFTSSPWAYKGHIFCLSEAGDCYVIEAGPNFKVVEKNSLGEMCMATPAIADSSLLIRTYSNLYRLSNRL